MSAVDLDCPELYINRELSWLDFNLRVLEEAQDPTNPLLERVKFMAIVANNLDEFFEVRVAGISQIRESGGGPTGPDGLTPEEQLRQIADQAHRLVGAQYRCWNEDLVPALAQEGIHLWEARRLRGRNLEFVRRYWQEELLPTLTPIVIDPAHPFPLVLNKALCIGALLQRKKGVALGVVTVPRVLPRILRIPSTTDSNIQFVTLAGIIDANLNRLFTGYRVLGSAPFRITRNSELYVNEEEADNLLEEIAEQLKHRRRGDVVRLEIATKAPDQLVRMLQEQFELDDGQVYRVDGPVNLNRVMTIYNSVSRPDLKYPPFAPVSLRLPQDPEEFFARLRAGDVLVHHPYESFDAVLDFIRMAAVDPKVLAIKQTLYRTGGDDSQVVQALLAAAEREKEVTVLVELKARFDEEHNIEWARQFEENGVHVVYGLVGLKTHCKLSLLVRRDQDRLRRYAHLGTGNYNHITTRFYTDLGLLTAREDITTDVAEVFDLLTARSQETFAKLLVAPGTMMDGLLERIAREADNARAGRPAAIVAKMNGLMDPKVIKALYRASQAGVEIDLIVRGICCLRPGLPGISEHIRVYSIIGRYLEHSRVFYFANNGDPELWLGSADWMNRNLRGRVEVLFPVEDKVLQARVYEQLLVLCLQDRVKTRALQPDGTYVRRGPARGEPALCMQDTLMRIALGQPVAIPPLPAARPASRNRHPSRRP